MQLSQNNLKIKVSTSFLMISCKVFYKTPREVSKIHKNQEKKKDVTPVMHFFFDDIINTTTVMYDCFDDIINKPLQ